MQDIDETSADVPPPTPLLSIDEIQQELFGALKFETRATNLSEGFRDMTDRWCHRCEKDTEHDHTKHGWVMWFGDLSEITSPWSSVCNT